MQDATLFYTAILIISALTLLIIGVGISYLRVVQKYVKLKEDDKQLKSDVVGEAQKQLELAQQEAKKIIQATSEKATDIIRNAEVLSGEEKTMLSNALKQASQEHLAVYKQVLDVSKKESTEVLQNISKDIQTSLSTEFGSFQTNLKRELAVSNEAVKQAMAEAGKSVKQQIEGYKQARIKQLDAAIFGIIREVVKRVLSREIDRQEHEKLVIKALEEAKRQNAFEK